MHPESLINDSRNGILELRWQDGLVQRLGNTVLRQRCQCADCRSACKAGSMSAQDTGIRITGIAPVGAYGVQLVFSDGHDRGIYPWAYLRGLG